MTIEEMSPKRVLRVVVPVPEAEAAAIREKKRRDWFTTVHIAEDGSAIVLDYEERTPIVVDVVR